MDFCLRRGLDVDIGGRPRQAAEPGREVSTVAVLPGDHPGLRPRALVEEGARVCRGQPLVADRERPELVLTAPGGGRVLALESGPRRALRAVVVALEEPGPEVLHPSTPRLALGALTRGAVTERLLVSGLWCALRARPFGGPADPRSTPGALLVTALDTEPLAARPEVVLAGREEAFEDGLRVLARLLDGPLYLCVAPHSPLPGGDAERVTRVTFSGPHPAGLPGTHAHFLAPAGRGRVIWHVGYEDVAAVGELFVGGRVPVERVIALAGPGVRDPRLLRTRHGANLTELVKDECAEGPCRIVSGSALAGRQAAGWGRHLGRFHRQVCVLLEGTGPRAGSWLTRRWAGLLGRPRRADTTARHGAPAPLLPGTGFEHVLPLDLLPTPLLRALLAGDCETAERLGCLELEEEDLALCSHVCPSKLDYGGALRRVLDEIASAG